MLQESLGAWGAFWPCGQACWRPPLLQFSVLCCLFSAFQRCLGSPLETKAREVSWQGGVESGRGQVDSRSRIRQKEESQKGVLRADNKLGKVAAPMDRQALRRAKGHGPDSKQRAFHFLKHETWPGEGTQALGLLPSNSIQSCWSLCLGYSLFPGDRGWGRWGKSWLSP